MRHALITLWLRLAAALVVAALLVPVPRPDPVQQARAFAVSMGVLCSAAGHDPAQAHHDGHCTLCLTPSANPRPADLMLDRMQIPELVARCLGTPGAQVAQRAAQNHHARAPPSSRV